MAAPGKRRPSLQDPGLAGKLYALSAMGVELFGAIVLLGAIGYGLDRWLGSTPWLTVVGTLLGVVSGMVIAIRQALAANRQPGAPPTRHTGPDKPI